MNKILKAIFISLLCGFIFSPSASAQALTYQEALDQYMVGGCSLQSQTKEQICFDCTNLTPYPDCASPIDVEVVLHWQPSWDGVPDCITECEEGWNRASDLSCICDAVIPPTCIPDGSCSAPAPACDTTTNGVDNCNNSCSLIGEDCITPPTDTSFDEESNGLVTILATGYELNNNFGSSTYSWVEEGNLMTAIPEDMLRFDTPTSPSQSPMLSYNIRLTTGGAYYFWAKGIAVSGTSDSFHFGIDGVFLDSMTLLADPWSNLLQNYSDRAMITLVPGDYVLNIWMREDGVKLEEFVFAKDPNWTP